MAENINIEVLLETAKAAKSVEELESSINELKDAATQLGSTDKDFEKLTATAGKLKRRVEETETAVDQAAKGFRGLQQFVNIGTGIAAGFSIAEGASSLFGQENEELAKSLQRVTGAMAILNGLQEIRTALIEDSTIATKAAAAAQSLYSTVVGTSTGALKAFRLALLATGIGAIVVAIGLLIANWDKLTDAIGLTNKALENRKKLLETLQSLNSSQLSLIEKRIELRRLEGRGIEDLEKKQEQLLRKQVKDSEDAYNTQVELLRKNLLDQTRDFFQDYTDGWKTTTEIVVEDLKKGNVTLLDLNEEYLKEKLKLNEKEIDAFRKAQEETVKIQEKSVEARIALDKKLEEQRNKSIQRNVKSFTNFFNFIGRGEERRKQLLINDAEYYQKLTELAERSNNLIQNSENMSNEERIKNTKNLLEEQIKLYEQQQIEVEASFKKLRFTQLKEGAISQLSGLGGEIFGALNQRLRLKEDDENYTRLLEGIQNNISGILDIAIGNGIEEIDEDSLVNQLSTRIATIASEFGGFADVFKEELSEVGGPIRGDFLEGVIEDFNKQVRLIETEYNTTLKELEKSNKEAFNAIADSAIETSLALAELSVAEAEFQRTIIGFEEGKQVLKDFNDEVRQSQDDWDELSRIYQRAGENLNIFQRFKRSSDEGLFKNDENNLKRQIGLIEQEGQARLEAASESSLNELNLINNTADARIAALQDLINKYPALQDKALKEIDKIDKERDKAVQIELKRSGEEFIDIQEETNEKRLGIQKEYKEKAVALEKDLAKQIAQQFGDTLVSISSRVANQRIANIERTRDAQLAAIDAEEEAANKKEENLSNQEKARLAREEMFATKREQIEKKAAIESAKISNKQALLEWRMTLAETTAQASLLLLKALKTGPVVPNLVAGGLAAGLGALQVGAVIGAKPQMEIPQFASGGFVSGPGGPKDDKIPAMLSNGESVINAKSTSMFAPLLDSINRAGGGSPIIPKFATGGMVTQQTITQQLDTSNLQETIMMLGDRPIKTYVVSQDITNAQHNDNRLKSRTTF